MTDSDPDTSTTEQAARDGRDDSRAGAMASALKGYAIALLVALSLIAISVLLFRLLGSPDTENALFFVAIVPSSLGILILIGIPFFWAAGNPIRVASLLLVSIGLLAWPFCVDEDSPGAAAEYSMTAGILLGLVTFAIAFHSWSDIMANLRKGTRLKYVASALFAPLGVLAMVASLIMVTAIPEYQGGRSPYAPIALAFGVGLGLLWSSYRLIRDDDDVPSGRWRSEERPEPGTSSRDDEQ